MGCLAAGSRCVSRFGMENGRAHSNSSILQIKIELIELFKAERREDAS